MIKLKCPNCKHEWNYKGTAWRTTCSECRTNVRTGLPTPWENASVKSKRISKNTSPISDEVIADSVMSGEIIKAIKKIGIDPKKKGGDNIPILLQDEKLEFALAKASREWKKSPESIIRNALKKWLKEEGYLDG